MVHLAAVLLETPDSGNLQQKFLINQQDIKDSDKNKKKKH